jgi:hypothetical protein
MESVSTPNLCIMIKNMDLKLNFLGSQNEVLALFLMEISVSLSKHHFTTVDENAAVVKNDYS